MEKTRESTGIADAWRTYCTDETVRTVELNTRISLLVLVFASANVVAGTEIYRCSLEDGTIAFQEMPCPEPAESADESGDSGESNGDSSTPAPHDAAFDFVNPFDEPSGAPMPVEAALPEALSEDRAACEKTTRDAIDVIDLEMRENPYSKEQGQEYLAQLLELTRQLRACKQL